MDEGQRLKNKNSMIIKNLKELPSANRLLLSGTPLQNHLSELWSLLNFLLPTLFDSLDLFLSWFDFSDVNTEASGGLEQDAKVKIVNQLHRILRPFLLRRLKRDGASPFFVSFTQIRWETFFLFVIFASP